MENSSGVEVEPKSIFTTTSARHVPSLLDLMKIESKEDLDEIKPPSTGAKKKVNAFAVLTPKLAEVFQSTDISTADILVAIVKMLKASGANERASEPEVEEIDLEDDNKIERLIGEEVRNLNL